MQAVFATKDFFMQNANQTPQNVLLGVISLTLVDEFLLQNPANVKENYNHALVWASELIHLQCCGLQALKPCRLLLGSGLQL